jgi:hypothetical protein
MWAVEFSILPPTHPPGEKVEARARSVQPFDLLWPASGRSAKQEPCCSNTKPHLNLLHLGQMVGDHVLVGVLPRLGLPVGVDHRGSTLRRRLVLYITFYRGGNMDERRGRGNPSRQGALP